MLNTNELKEKFRSEIPTDNPKEQEEYLWNYLKISSENKYQNTICAIISAFILLGVFIVSRFVFKYSLEKILEITFVVLIFTVLWFIYTKIKESIRIQTYMEVYKKVFPFNLGSKYGLVSSGNLTILKTSSCEKVFILNKKGQVCLDSVVLFEDKSDFDVFIRSNFGNPITKDTGCQKMFYRNNVKKSWNFGKNKNFHGLVTLFQLIGKKGDLVSLFIAYYYFRYKFLLLGSFRFFT